MVDHFFIGINECADSRAGIDKNILFSLDFSILLCKSALMKLLSKLALLLLLAGVLALLFSFLGAKFPQARVNLTNLLSAKAATVVAAASKSAPPAVAGTVIDASQPASDGEPRSHVRIPAIRGESCYGWVQLPRGTNVELIQQSAGNLIVRWEGITVRVPSSSAVTGAIALRQTPRLARN
jgi:hypothetical protein